MLIQFRDDRTDLLAVLGVFIPSGPRGGDGVVGEKGDIHSWHDMSNSLLFNSLHSNGELSRHKPVKRRSPELGLNVSQVMRH